MNGAAAVTGAIAIVVRAVMIAVVATGEVAVIVIAVPDEMTVARVAMIVDLVVTIAVHDQMHPDVMSRGVKSPAVKMSGERNRNVSTNAPIRAKRSRVKNGIRSTRRHSLQQSTKRPPPRGILTLPPSENGWAL